MSPSKPLIVAGIAAAALAVAVSKFAVAATDPIKELSANEGIYVDPTNFAIKRGMSKVDPQAHIMKLGAREVTNGAIIFRAGDKLYLVDANPSSASMLNSFEDAFAPPG